MSDKVSRRDFAKTTVAAGTAAVALPGTVLGNTRQERANAPVETPSDSWREGLTIAAEYYTEEEHYLFDEGLVADHFWLFADHESRIPDAGDSFTFAVGRRRSVTITRDDSGQIRAYHNPIANGLNPCHVGTAEGHIFVNLSASDEPPDFESAVADFRVVGQRHATAELKVGARRSLPMYANWKLALENFLECYHCGPAHAHLVTVHDADLTMSPERKAELAPKLAQWVPPSVRPGGGGTGMAAGGSADDVSITGRAYLLPGVVTASLDGKPVAPLLPPFDDYTHGYRETSTAWSTGYWAAYDDYVVTTRFTPRDVELTDVELLWLVHPDAEEGVDYDVDNLTALWEITVQEDIWVCENNQIGIRSGGYELGRYATHESGRGSPAGFVAWYMAAIAGDVGRIDTY